MSVWTEIESVNREVSGEHPHAAYRLDPLLLKAHTALGDELAPYIKSLEAEAEARGMVLEGEPVILLYVASKARAAGR